MWANASTYIFVYGFAYWLLQHCLDVGHVYGVFLLASICSNKISEGETLICLSRFKQIIALTLYLIIVQRDQHKNNTFTHV